MNGFNRSFRATSVITCENGKWYGWNGLVFLVYTMYRKWARQRAFIMVTVASSEKACYMKNSEKDWTNLKCYWWVVWIISTSQHLKTKYEVNAQRRTHMQTNTHCNKKNTHTTPKHTKRTEQTANEERERKWILTEICWGLCWFCVNSNFPMI